MLSVRDMDVFYGDVQAIRQVSFDVSGGEVVSLIGSNGAGKSTTVRAVSGLLRPRAGRILFNGREISRAPSACIVEMGISHIPEGRQLFPKMTVQENLEMGAQFSRNRKNLRESLDRVLNFFPRLSERLKQRAGTLSGGEQQMLAIGRGLMSQPSLLMLDEPSLGLAPLLVSAIFGIIRQINEEGMSILLIEQNVYHALKLSRRAYVMENGAIVMHGESATLLDDPHIRRTYLGL